jgi:ribonuclease D
MAREHELAQPGCRRQKDTMSDRSESILSRPEELALCCSYLRDCPCFGFDTEFVGENTYQPQLCLIQVATPERLILIDPLSVGPLDGFWDLITDPAHLIVVHAGREEVRLCRHWTGKPPANLFDLQIAVGLVGFHYPLGHASLVNQVLGVSIAKGETLTEWRDRPLTPSQIQYAFDDVRYLLPLWQRLSERLRALGREEWAREEFTRLETAMDPEEIAVERWRKLRGLGGLDRRRLAVVRALSQWREETAARINRPPRTIVRDDLLIEIARRNSSRERDLQIIRGLPRRDLPAIARVIEEARALPLESCPVPTDREQDPPQLPLIANVLSAALGNFCVREQLAQSLVANSQDVKSLARAAILGQPVEDSLLTQGWRQTHVLPHLQGLLEGRLALRIVDAGAGAPLEIEPIG